MSEIIEFEGQQWESAEERPPLKNEIYLCRQCTERGPHPLRNMGDGYKRAEIILRPVSAPPQPPAPLNSLSTGFSVKIIFHTNEAHDKIKSETFVREKIGAIFDTYGVQEEIDYTLEVRRLYE